MDEHVCTAFDVGLLVNVSPPCLMSSALLYVYAGTVKVYMTSQYLYPYIFPIGLCAKMIMKEVTQC